MDILTSKMFVRLCLLHALLMHLSCAAKVSDKGFNNVAGLLREVDGGQVIGHAGASYYVPEETMAGYQVITPKFLNLWSFGRVDFL